METEVRGLEEPVEEHDPEEVVPVVEREEDIREEQRLEQFLQVGCGCSQKCWTNFDPEYLRATRANLLELSSHELDMVLMGQIMATTHCGGSTTTNKRTHIRERQRSFTTFIHGGLKVCKNTFMFIHGIGEKRLRNVRRYYLRNGLTNRVHGNTGNTPRHALSVSDIEEIVLFIKNYAEVHAILLPGRVPGVRDFDRVQLLPSSTTKKDVYQEYVRAVPGKQVCSYQRFLVYWNKYLPGIQSLKAMSDLCWVCQKNSTAIVRSTNLPIERQTTALQQAREHVELVRKEREYYRSVLKEAATLLRGLFTDPVTELYSPPLSRPLAVLNTMAHYSFDYAQQVHFPSNPLQPGPIYFLTPRKCGIFGVCCEAIPQQVNFLVDESFSTGKGANAVISMIHYYLEHHGVHSAIVHFNADNCAGQNKNNAMIQYLLWRVLTGLNKRITLSFLQAGHTKFSPDWCFGLLKQRFRRSLVGSMYDLVDVVKRSSSVNIAQLVGTPEGDCIVQSYDWTGYLAPFFKRIRSIKTFHHFVVDCQSHGMVNLRKTSDSPVMTEQLLRDPTVIPSSHLPPVVTPTGLSSERQWYLFDKIREFCPEECKDLTCPHPSCARPATCSSLRSTPEMDVPEAGEEVEVPLSSTKRRKCNNCGLSGHNSRTCTN